jgi:hypothetical protein
VPVGNVLVGDARCDVKHNDTALSVDVVSITKTTKLFLTRSIPDIELDLAQVLLTVSSCAEVQKLVIGAPGEVRGITVVKPRG